MYLDNEKIKELLQKAKEDKGCFDDLIIYIRPYVQSKARYMLSDEQDAEDIFQDVALRIYNNIDKLEKNNFMGWLKTVVTNGCTDIIRKRHKKTEFDTDVEFVHIDGIEDFEVKDEDINKQPEIQMDNEVKKKIVDEVIDSLPFLQRQVITMRYLDDMKIKDIADELGVNKNTIKSRINSAHKNIGSKVEEIQKRDDIKLYNYSPVLFFFLLFRDRNNNLLLTKSGAFTTSQLTHASGKVASTAVKAKGLAGLSTATKLLLGAAVVGTVAFGANVGYKKYQENKINEAYASDNIEVAIEGDFDNFIVGDTRKVNVSYSSENELNYEMNVRTIGKCISLNGDELTAIEFGKSRVIVDIKSPIDGSVVKIEELYVVVSEKDTNLNALGQLMLANGYTKRHCFRPGLPWELRNKLLYQDFDWSLVTTDYKTFMNEPTTGIKGEEEEKPRKLDKNYTWDYETVIGADGYPIKLMYESDIIHTAASYTFQKTGKNYHLSANYYGSDDLLLKFDEESQNYYLDGYHGKVYPDLNSPILAIANAMNQPTYEGEKIEEINGKFTYNDNGDLISMEIYGGLYTFHYENGRVERISAPYNYEHYVYYYDNGLLMGVVGVQNNIVQGVTVYTYE